MERNDAKLEASNAYLKLLIDSSAFIAFQKIGAATGTHPMNLLELNPNIDYYFSNAVVNEFVRGSQGLSPDTVNMLERSLEDEMAVIGDGLKDNRHLYIDKNGKTRWTTLNTISSVDSGQILLCQNHDDLVLLTNDHNMLKNATALLDRRLMDVETLLRMMSDVRDRNFQPEWKRLRAWYDQNYGYKAPKTVRMIPDRRPGKVPPHLQD